MSTVLCRPSDRRLANGFLLPALFFCSVSTNLGFEHRAQKLTASESCENRCRSADPIGSHLIARRKAKQRLIAQYSTAQLRELVCDLVFTGSQSFGHLVISRRPSARYCSDSPGRKYCLLIQYIVQLNIIIIITKHCVSL